MSAGARPARAASKTWAAPRLQRLCPDPRQQVLFQRSLAEPPTRRVQVVTVQSDSTPGSKGLRALGLSGRAAA